MHRRLTSAMAVVAASAMALLPVYPASAQTKDGFPELEPRPDRQRLDRCDREHAEQHVQLQRGGTACSQAHPGSSNWNGCRARLEPPNSSNTKRPGSLCEHTAVQGSFLTVVLAPRHFFAADNPAATVVIRSLILLGARRDGGYLFQDLFQDCNLPRDAPAVRNACLASDSWPAD